MRNRKPVVAILFPLLFGAIALSQTLARPRLSAIHAVDVVSLVAAGMCFGVALIALVTMVVGARKA